MWRLLCSLCKGLDAVEHRVERDLERSGVPLDLREEQAALQGGERGQGQVAGVRAGWQVTAGVHGPEPVADPGLPAAEPPGHGHASRGVDLGGGHVDILVNNAGVFPFGPTQGATDEDIDAVYAVNVKAPFILTGELAPAMAARGKGSIINVLTMVAHFGVAGMALYGSSKAALTLLTKAWSAEFGPRGVRVNAVSPGPTRTGSTEVMGDQLDQLAALAPAGRPAAPEEIASAISYLAGDQAS